MIMKLSDLLKVTATGQQVIVRLMFPSDYEDFDYDMEFNFVHYRTGAKLDPAYVGDNSNVMSNKDDRKVALTDVFKILLKMEVDNFHSDIDFGKTEWDDYAPIGDYDINDRIIVELKPITYGKFAPLVPKKYLINCEAVGYVTRFDLYYDVKTLQVKTKD
jgi:hypothetical protein